MKKTIIGIVGGGVIALVIAYAFYAKEHCLCPFDNCCGVAIVSPKSGDEVDCEKLTDDGQCSISLKVSLTKGKLQDDEKIYILAQAGGVNWYVTGSAIEPALAVKGRAVDIDYVTIGPPNDPNRKYNIIALATSVGLSNGQPLDSLPEHTCASAPVNITRGRP